MLSAYRESFTDGAQQRNAAMLWRAATDGSAWAMLDKLRAHNAKRLTDLRERREAALEEQKRHAEEVRAERERQREEAVAVASASASAGSAGHAGLRQRIEQAMERDQEFRRVMGEVKEQVERQGQVKGRGRGDEEGREKKGAAAGAGAGAGSGGKEADSSEAS